ALRRHRDDHATVHVREVEPTVVPARTLGRRESVRDDGGHRTCSRGRRINRSFVHRGSSRTGGSQKAADVTERVLYVNRHRDWYHLSVVHSGHARCTLPAASTPTLYCAP